MNSGQNMCDSKGDLSKITLADRLKMKEILTATIASLCKNSLGFDFELTIEGLLGITVDKTDVLLISIREVIDHSSRISNSCDQVTSQSHYYTDVESASQRISPNESVIKPCKPLANKRSTSDGLLQNNSIPSYDVYNMGEERRPKKRKIEQANCTVTATGGEIRGGATETALQSYRRQSNGVKTEISDVYVGQQYDLDQTPVKVKTERVDDRYCEPSRTGNGYVLDTGESFATDMYGQEDYEGFLDEQLEYEYVADEGSIGSGYHSTVAGGSSSKKFSGVGGNRSGVRQPSSKQFTNMSRKLTTTEKLTSNKKPSAKTDSSIVSNRSTTNLPPGSWPASVVTAGNKDSNQTMIQRALNLVREGQLSAATAISIFGIARSTFYKKLADLVKTEGPVAEREADVWVGGEGETWDESGDVTDNGAMNAAEDALAYNTYTEY